MQETTTIEIDRKTHEIIRLYCLINNIKVKHLIKYWAEENLDSFKEKVEEFRKLKSNI